MILSKERLLAEAASSGYRPDVFEKVVHLLTLLQRLQTHPYLKGRLVLKGGTALNLFIYDLPRISVDIDLNYIGSPDREVMLVERPRIDEAVSAVCSREGFSIRSRPNPTEHAGGKWFLDYQSALGRKGNLELDLNFGFRIPLWPVAARDSYPIGSFQAREVLVLDEHEVAAGKLTALLARHATRDLFDAHQLLNRGGPENAFLRLAFVVYGAMNRRDWRKVSPKDVDFDASELEESLLPMLPSDFLAEMGNVSAWAARLVQECREQLEVVLPLAYQEREFLDRLLDHGEIEPSLLTQDVELRERIRLQPWLEWKAFHVRQFKGL